MKNKFMLTAIILLPLLFACKEAEKPAAPVPTPETVQKKAVVELQPGCQQCHIAVQLDSNHDLACTDCHRGDNNSNDREIAHIGLITAPAAPTRMAETCGSCHPKQLETCGKSLHFTLNNAVNLVRSHFDLEPNLADLTEIPEAGIPPADKSQLVDDLLRRRCLRCHVYTAGDSYPYVQRGTGCAACHLQYTAGKLQSHAFTLPTERNCLSCHYGNKVGTDFVGRYEHDYNWEYRTPYTTKQEFHRPYGVELHNLAPDIHQQRGFTCLDCHSSGQLSGQEPSIRCRDCHAPAADSVPALANVSNEGGQLILTTRGDGKKHPVPGLKHPAHDLYKDRVACQVCHAQWGFNDGVTHLLLSYSDDADPWDRLTVQSSSVVENFLDHNLYSDEDELEPSMPDSINNTSKPGIWYLGFSQRRWENILIDRDNDDGIIKVFRPILDLRLSAVDEDETVIHGFDNLAGSGTGLLPYTPHTTGPAGMFYEQRFIDLLNNRSKTDGKNSSRQLPATLQK